MNDVVDLNFEGEEELETLPEEVPVEGPLGSEFGIIIEEHEGIFNAKQVKFLVYAESGVGKTRFASTWPDVLFLDIDKGMSSVKRKVGRIRIDNTTDLERALKFLYSENGHPFKTVVLDSLNELQHICMKAIISHFPNIRRPYDDLASQSDYGKMLADFDRYVRLLKGLSLNIVFVANQAKQEYETDAIQPGFVGKNTARNIARIMDIIGYLYKTDTGDKGSAKRVMVFDAARYVTKDRSDVLPTSMDDPTYNAMNSYWKKER